MGIIFIHVEQIIGLFTVPLSWPIIFFFIICQFKTKQSFKAVGEQYTKSHSTCQSLIGLELVDNGKIMGTVKSPKG